MGKTYRRIIYILTSILIICIFFTLYYTQQLNTIMEKENSRKGRPTYHFVAILYGMDGSYWSDISAAIKEQCKKHQVVLEDIYIKDNLYQETLKYFDIAIESNVEGIIVPGYNTDEFTALVDKAFFNGIPVITIHSDCVGSKRVNFIGIDDFKLGIEAGKQIKKTHHKQNKVGILVNSEVRNKESIGFIEKGFLQETAGEPHIELVTISQYKDNVIDVKNTLVRLLEHYPEVNTIICTSSNGTLGIAGQIIDSYKVGDISIIGYEADEKILEYIKKGIVQSTIILDPRDVGAKSIESLMSVKTFGYSLVEAYQSIDIINEDNVDQYIRYEEEQKREGEE
ncbi:MAG: periplasmic binding protein/LacI transcriptional regulator [Clostridia bacterium]|nr:periplasmic binding protein/LacI transcriptional regulator [Clostridia bacterium]